MLIHRTARWLSLGIGLGLAGGFLFQPKALPATLSGSSFSYGPLTSNLRAESEGLNDMVSSAADPGCNASGQGRALSPLESTMYGGVWRVNYDAVTITDPGAGADDEPVDSAAKRGLLGNISAIAIPTRRSYQESSWPRNRGNARSFWGRRHGLVYLDYNVDGKDLMKCMPVEAKEDAYMRAFCPSGDRGGLVIRSAALTDIRWQRRGGGPLTQIDVPFMCRTCADYWGDGCDWIQSRPGAGMQTVVIPGGLPVVSWKMNPQDASFARQGADRQYLFGKIDRDNASSIQTFEFLLRTRASAFQVETNIKCPRSLDRSERKICSQSRHQTQLAGFIYRRTYSDLRVNLAPDSSAGLRIVGRIGFYPRIVQQSAVYRTGTSQPATWLAYVRQVEAACGVAGGNCGGTLANTGNKAFTEQISYAPGGDDGVRMVQMCNLAMADTNIMSSSETGRAAGDTSGASSACFNGRNPLAEQLTDGVEVTRMLLDTITPGARKSDTTTVSDRRRTMSGVRTIDMGGDTSRLGSQWRRVCESVWRRDSLRVVSTTAPGFINDLTPALNRLKTCLTRGGEVPSTTMQGPTAAPLPSARRPPGRP